MALDLSLLDALALCMDCYTVSELRELEEPQRVRLAQKLSFIRPNSAALPEWNDALCYLTREGPRPSQEAARSRLVQWLSQPQSRLG